MVCVFVLVEMYGISECPRMSMYGISECPNGIETYGMCVCPSMV